MTHAPAKSGAPILIGALLALSTAPAAAAEPPPGWVPLGENFSVAERAAAITAALAGGYLVVAGHTLFDAPTPSMGPAAPGSFDRRISERLAGSGGRFLARVPDYGGAALPWLPLLAYGVDSALLAAGRGTLVSSDPNPHHRLMAYVEAIGWTYFVTGSVKYLVGRPRPYTAAALDRPDLAWKPSEDNLSFFSGHAASSFAAGAFVTEDVSRALLRGPLAGAGAASRLLLGRVAPALVGYGLPALIGVSRIVDLQHWPSDVLVGGLVGTLTARLVYAIHFDDDGRPRRRHGQSASRVFVAPVLLPPLVPGPSAHVAHVGLGLSGQL